MVPACWARVGTRFLFSETFESCGSCELRPGCVSSLVKGRQYEVLSLRRKTFACPYQGDKYRVVEVKPSGLELAMPRNKCFEGAVLHFTARQCDRRFCKNYSFCVPEGASEGERWRVVGLLEAVECPIGMALVKASLEQVP